MEIMPRHTRDCIIIWYQIINEVEWDNEGAVRWHKGWDNIKDELALDLLDSSERINKKWDPKGNVNRNRKWGRSQRHLASFNELKAFEEERMVKKKKKKSQKIVSRKSRKITWLTRPTFRYCRTAAAAAALAIGAVTICHMTKHTKATQRKKKSPCGLSGCLLYSERALEWPHRLVKEEGHAFATMP